jgi:hypothetical protein
MKILDNDSVGSPSPREIILNSEDLEKLVSLGELQAGPITIRFKKEDGEGFGISRSKSWSSSETTGAISDTSDNWSSSTSQSWGRTTGESRRKDEGDREN